MDPVILELKEAMIHKLFEVRRILLKLMEESIQMNILDHRKLQPILERALIILDRYLFIERFDDIDAQPPTMRLDRLWERASNIYTRW